MWVEQPNRVDEGERVKRADGTSGGGGIHYHRSRETVNHARGIVNIGTLNIETWAPGRFTRERRSRKGILNFPLGSILSPDVKPEPLGFLAAFLSHCATPIPSLVLNRSRGIGISPMFLPPRILSPRS